MKQTHTHTKSLTVRTHHITNIHVKNIPIELKDEATAALKKIYIEIIKAALCRTTHISRIKNHAPTNHQLTHIHTHVMPNERVRSNEIEKESAMKTATQMSEWVINIKQRQRILYTKICAHIPADVGIFQLSNEISGKKQVK